MASLTYELPKLNLLPYSYRTITLEDWLFNFIVALLIWIDDSYKYLQSLKPSRRPTISKMALYFIVRYSLNLLDHLTVYQLNRLSESFFDWLIQPQGRAQVWQMS